MVDDHAVLYPMKRFPFENGHGSLIKKIRRHILYCFQNEERVARTQRIAIITGWNVKSMKIILRSNIFYFHGG